MIKKLNEHYSFTTPASVHDEEALTALELAGRTTAKLNEVVGDQNNLRQETERALERFETQNIPDEVRDQIDQNVKDGTFDQYINKYIGNIQQRVENLVENLPEGSTTMDAELIDIRVDEYGTTYDSAGAGVRGQVRDVNYKLHSSPYKAAGTNIKMTVNTSTGGVALEFYGLLAMKTKQGVKSTPWADLITELGDCCIYDAAQPNNVNIYVAAHTVLTYNLATSKLRLVYTGAHINSIRNNDLILFHNAWGEPMGGALLDIITRDRVAACEARFGTMPRHDVQAGAMYISQSGTCSVLGKGDTGAVELTFSKPLVARIGTIQEGLDWTTVTEHVPATVNGEACTVTIQAYNALVFNVTEKKLRVRSAVDKILPDDFILIQASYAAVIGGYLYPQMNKPSTGGGSAPADLNILFFDSVDDLPSDLPDGTMAAVKNTFGDVVDLSGVFDYGTSLEHLGEVCTVNYDCTELLARFKRGGVPVKVSVGGFIITTVMYASMFQSGADEFAQIVKLGNIYGVVFIMYTQIGGGVIQYSCKQVETSPYIPGD